MNSYIITVEHCGAKHSASAPSGIECIKAFYAEHPKYFAGDDATYLVLLRESSKISIRYLVYTRSKPIKIELIGSIH
jgi:hypothetical protein